ncbi:MerR family transcriptional regulator [Planobispora takensis]|uniref:HTH merR-type domain-containing protein n=1 Tax=Planobispora takensis TaxID=1367882 RepID=A0A8J3WTF7_9ACTN|nr:MerR family transcriptional regulator [Planobispora takensis]GII01794.1 hypothetical protein Pta02_38020 [Planobispora takensis]
MAGKETAGRRWSIGELARASGLTVRALYHYDEIGLLRAGERTASGHRRYTGDDVRRLYRVRALRALGLPLEKIAEVLADPADDLDTMRALLAVQLRDLEEQAGRIHRLTQEVRGLLCRIDEESMPGPEQFMATLEMMSMFDAYLTREQQEQLAERRAALGPEGVEEAKLRWAGLVEELLGHAQAGTPADDPRVRALVARWDALADRFHADGEAGERTRAAARRMWRDNGTEISRNLPWPVDRMTALVAYVERVRRSEA